MADSEDIIHGNFILLKGCSRGYVTDENVEQVWRIHAKFSARFMVISHDYRKFTWPMRVSYRQDILLLIPWRTGAILGLVSYKKQIFLNTMQYISLRLLMVWVIRPHILLIQPTKMAHYRTGTHKSSGTTSRSMSLNIRLIIEYHTQRYTRQKKHERENGSPWKKDTTNEMIEDNRRCR